MWTLLFFFFNDTATTEIYTLSLHDALPISCPPWSPTAASCRRRDRRRPSPPPDGPGGRSRSGSCGCRACRCRCWQRSRVLHSRWTPSRSSPLVRPASTLLAGSAPEAHAAYERFTCLGAGLRLKRLGFCRTRPPLPRTGVLGREPRRSGSLRAPAMDVRLSLRNGERSASDHSPL